jgi:hypothetical protein
MGRLQQEMRAYREKVAPLPIEDTRRLHATAPSIVAKDLASRVGRHDNGEWACVWFQHTLSPRQD